VTLSVVLVVAGLSAASVEAGALAARGATPALEGVVRDSGGRPVAGATVVVTSQGQRWTVVTSADGAFVVADAVLPAQVEVAAAGFAVGRAQAAASPVEVVILPIAVRESVVVTTAQAAGEWRARTTAATEIHRELLDILPGVTLDERLRTMSGFSLFRRTSARAANPTTHGVTMRGLSASGASRGLVLFEGVPLNDAFGSWVTWTRVPGSALESVELVRGPQGDTFGSDALGGAITLSASERQGAAAAIEGGSERLATVDLGGGFRRGRVLASGAASWFTTDGVVPLEAASRGAVDRPADAAWFNAFGQVRLSDGARGQRITVQGWGSQDDRGNGTAVQRNRMTGGTLSAAYERWGLDRPALVTARLSVTPNAFDQTQSSVAAGRATETLTSTQRIETTTSRALVELGRAFASTYVVARATLARTASDFTDVRTTSRIERAVIDRSQAVSVHASFAPAARVALGVGGRQEWRRAPEASSDRDRAAVGHASMALELSRRASLRGSIATSHRWPTLNEQIRSFQVGAVLTQANPDLLPERAVTGDLALWLGGAFLGRPASITIAGFRSVVRDAIANVTTQTTPSIIRQRQNAGDADARGVELDGELAITARGRLRGSVTYVNARFRDSREPALEGKRLPQVPRVAVGLSGDVRLPARIVASVAWRSTGTQFDDDRNAFELARASQADVRVAGRMGAMGWFVVGENVTDARIETARTPLVSLAQGRAVRAGLTVTWPAAR
jgi:outer membrane receptor protein involved in Fe transport